MLKSRRRRRLRFTAALLLIAIVIVILFWDSNTRLVVDTYSVSNGRLPQSFDGLRIVQLSDLHTTRYGDENLRLIDEVREQQPDIIAVTGDLIDKERDETYVRELMTELVGIAPVYYVTGNHEWASGWVHDLFSILEECGVKVLRNSFQIIERGGDTIVLAGVDDPNGPYDMKTPAQLVQEIRDEYGDPFILMLAHRNDEISTWAELGVDVVLCGHAHGGLVRLPFTDGLIAPNREFFPTYTSGIYREGGTQMLVSRGLGNSGNTLRLFNNPQIVVAILED